MGSRRCSVLFLFSFLGLSVAPAQTDAVLSAPPSFEQLVAPYRSQQTPSARAQAATLASEVGELLARLHTTWLRRGVDDLT